MNKFKSFALTVLLLVLSVGALMPAMTLKAQDTNLICDVFPFLSNIGAFGIADSICGTPGEEDLSTAGQLVRFALSLIFVAIIAISIWIIIKAALKYIRSEGDQTKVEEAQKAIKNVFIGIGALFVGIIGIVIILAFFQAGEAIQTDTTPLGEEEGGVQNFLEGLTGQ